MTTEEVGRERLNDRLGNTFPNAKPMITPEMVAEGGDRADS